MQDGLLIRAIALGALLLVATGCGSGEAKVEADTKTVRSTGAEAGATPEQRIEAIQKSPIPDDIKAKKIAAIKGGG